MTSADKPGQVVEVRPEVMFLSELLDELTRGRIRIPRFQRPFVWRRDQMTDLLDSVYNQYPIGSLLVWETDVPIATLDHLGPFRFPTGSNAQSGYLLDGHQRLSTLAGALVARENRQVGTEESDAGRWHLAWNMRTSKFQHGYAEKEPDTLFPLTSLLDTLQFFKAIDRAREAFGSDTATAESCIAEVSRVARAFQHYRIPVIRIRQTGLSEAVEIFARLNSKGQSMTADQMVSALMYNTESKSTQFDLASEIDRIVERLAERGFGEIDRTAILRSILATIDEDIYRTDWTRLAAPKRKDLGLKLQDGVDRASKSLDLSIDFLQGQGVAIGRLLPYAMQLVVLSAAFDSTPEPSEERQELLRRWFWISSFSGWFGGANPSRVNSLVAEFRALDDTSNPGVLQNFDLSATALPYPSTFDMRSARTRALLLVMLSMQPKDLNGAEIKDPWLTIARMGPAGVGHIFDELPRPYAGNPANRMVRPPQASRGLLWRWILDELGDAGDEILYSHGLDKKILSQIKKRDIEGFVVARQGLLDDAERQFQRAVGVAPSFDTIGDSPIDTE